MVPAVVMALSCACFFATTLLVRQDAGGGALVAHYASRAVEIAACFALALAACRKSPSEDILLASGALAATAGLALELVLMGVRGSGAFVGAAAGVFNGWALAAFTLLFARLFCSFSPRGAMVLVPLSYAGAHVLFLVSCAVGSERGLYVKIGLTAVAFAGLAFLLKTRVPFGGDTAAVRKGDLSVAALFAQGRWRSLFFGVLVFPLLYGFTAQLCDMAEVGNGLFDVATEGVGIAFLAVAALVGSLRKKAIDPETLFAIVLPVFATAMLFLPLFWGDEVFVAGFVMKCGFLIYTSLMWTCVCAAADGNPSSSYLYFGMAIGSYHLAIMVGRLLAGFIGAFPPFSNATVALVSLVAIWLLSMASLAMLLMHRFGGRPGRGRNGDVRDGGEGAFEEFARHYGLSDREAAVCREFAHGRTVGYIADQLVVSPETVKTHLKRAYGKTGCHSRQDLIDAIERCGR